MIEIIVVIFFAFLAVWLIVVDPISFFGKSKHSFKTKTYAWSVCFNFHKKRIVSLNQKDGVFHEVFSCDKCRLSWSNHVFINPNVPPLTTLLEDYIGE